MRISLRPGRTGRSSRALVVSLLVLAAGLAGASHAQAAEDPFDVAVRNAQTFTTGRLNATTSRIPTTAWPFFTSGPRWTTTGARNWASGFLPGTLWYAYQATGDAALRTKAQNWQAGLAGQASNTSTHDVGFIVFDSFGHGYRLTGTDTYRQTVLRAAASLSTRYSPTVGAVRSWNSGPTEFKVIVDNMLNLELLFWGSKHGGQQAWYEQALSHALKTAQDHVRPDGSTYHLVIYDPATGAVKSRSTVQGHSASSTWARGQAWAVHGFTMAYRETGDARLLETARRVADWFIDHLPADHVPYWDFDAPGIPTEPRDTSAAAIAASGLLDLARLEPDATRSARYLSSGRSILGALTNPPWLSQGSGSEAVLLHGTYNKPEGSADTGLIWGDYFLQEALMRLRRIPPAGTALPVAAVTASSHDGNVPGNAVDGNLATRWSAAGDGQWLRLDLGTAQPIAKVTVAYHRGDERAARFDVQTSSDGVTWTTGARAVTSAATLEPETYDVPDTTARYVRLVGHGATGTTFTSVTEMAAFGATTTTPPPPATPAAPTALTASPGDSSVALSWTASSGATGYEVWRGTGSGAGVELSQLAGAMTSGTSFTDTTAVNGTTYTYAVRAINAAGGSDNSNLVTATPTAGTAAGIVYRGSRFAANPTATTLTVPAPTEARAGDLEVMAIAARGGPTITPPSGWTLVRRDVSSTTIRQAVYSHVVGTSEPASYTWRLSSSQAAAGGIIAYGGVSTATPVDVAGGRINPASTSVTAPSIVTTKPDTQLVGFFGMGASTSFTAPTGMVERGDVASIAGTYKVTMEAADETRRAAGATGTRAARAVKSAANIGQLVALSP